MNYIGEHLGIGKVGNLFVILSFVFALLSSISYFFAARENEFSFSWKKIGRIAFRLHGFSVFGIVGTLFIMLYNHYFEYEYVWHHSNKEMPMRYILSCFWEGQEGSFLLWTFWHVVIGFILQWKAKDWEAPVMTTVALVQTFLASMLLGIFIFGGHRIGSNPFTVLLREHPDYAGIPLFQNPNYVSKIDGRGLNPLLQNYWMTIHPPTLFLGFALTVVPFAYAIAGLWKKRFNDWVKPALPWTYMAIMVLGTGILMGGAWAYEALSFGGFWAWDPVENASLVPWLTLVGAGHLMLINKNKGQSLVAAFGLAILTFVLILYSTFLTRSGILGETSVHAFTDLGMSGQLLIYLLFFLVAGMTLLALNLKHIPKVKEEEKLWSREFWMFIGAVILLVSSFQIMFYTSLPVWNKLFSLEPPMAPAKDIIGFYNSWQLPFAFLVTLLIAVGQYFKYKDTDMKEFGKKMLVSFVIALILSLLTARVLSISNVLHILLLFSTFFAVAANADYALRVLGGKIRKAGASIAHIGFALVMMGALISTSKKDIISQNTSGKNINNIVDKINNENNILLTQGDTLPMGQYYVTYRGKRFEGINVYFDVDYFTKKDNAYEKEFTLSPLIQTNPRMGNVPEPDTRHFLAFDVYSHVTYFPADALKKEDEKQKDEYTAAKNFKMHKGDTIFSSNALIIFDSLSTNVNKADYGLKDSDIVVIANLRAVSISKTYSAKPLYVIRHNSVQPVAAKVDELGLQFMFWKLNPETKEVEISIQEKKSNIRDFIVMQAMIFPCINILWLGCFIMIIGTVIAIIERIRKNRQKDAK
jgi:cytochrome c-type biogenesis protein CcmF